MVLEKHLKPAFSGKLLDEITRQDIADLINAKLAPVSAREKPLSRGQVRNILAPLREMLNHAVDGGTLTANPATRCGRYMKESNAVKSNRLTLGKVLEPRRFSSRPMGQICAGRSERGD
jgi:hypothetical protein